MAGPNEKDKPRQSVVANTVNSFRNGATGFIDWLGLTKIFSDAATLTLGGGRSSEM